MSTMNPNPFQKNTNPNTTPPPITPPASLSPTPPPITPPASSSSTPPPITPPASSSSPPPITPATTPTHPASQTSPQHIPSPAGSSKRISPKVRSNEYRPTSKANFGCPFCLEEINTNDLLYYCIDCNETYTKKEAISEGLYRKSSSGDQYKCCNRLITGKRMCPNCEINAINRNDDIALLRLIPPEMIPTGLFGINNEFRLCMTGHTSSGKTQYIIELLNHITKKLTPSVSNTRFLDYKTDEIKNALNRKIFEEGKMLATPRGYLDPFLYNIDCKKKSYSSVFYDIAGENYSREAVDLQDDIIQACVWKSRNIILMLDATTLSEVRDRSDLSSFKKVAGLSATCEIMESLEAYLNFVAKNPEGKKFLNRVNLAVVFTKMDKFYGDSDLPQIIKDESTHLQKEKFDIEEIKDVNREMRAWVKMKEGSALEEALKECPNVMFFGVSSGNEKTSEYQVPTIRPNRLLDPYLWLLYKNGILI